MFSREAVREIRKLTLATTGEYVWQPGLQAGQPDLILGRPFIMNEFMPSTFTQGSYIGLWGDFSRYRIVDSMNFGVQRLNELYALTNEVGFIGRFETDAAPVLPEAFVRIILGA